MPKPHSLAKNPFLSILHASFPLFTTALGLGGLTGGLYSLLRPEQLPKIFGIPLAFTSEPSNNRHQPQTQAQTRDADPWKRAYLQAHAARNMASGLTILSLTAMWQFSASTRMNPMVEEAVRKCLGVVVGLGSVVGVLDGWIVGTYRRRMSGRTDGRENEEIEGKAKGHVVVAMVIGGVGVALWFA